MVNGEDQKNNQQKIFKISSKTLAEPEPEPQVSSWQTSPQPKPAP